MSGAQKTYLVTGGTGFLGSALVRRLVGVGAAVRVLDNNSRGQASRLDDVADRIDYVEADVRDPAAVARACAGVDVACHLAYVNGTEFFYSRPDLVLDVAVKGMINVLDGCLAHGVPELLVMSSSEVYHQPPVVPTDEAVPLTIPDVMNPRFSYAAGKIIHEIMAVHCAREARRVLIVRPHNVYGVDMGFEHVIPQFAHRMHALAAGTTGPILFPIQGDGTQTRSFVHVDDFTDGVMLVLEKGKDRHVYHVGTSEEVTIADLASLVGEAMGREVTVVPGPASLGGTKRRCPDITRIAALGYRPRHRLRDALPAVVRWYEQHPKPVMASHGR